MSLKTIIIFISIVNIILNINALFENADNCGQSPLIGKGIKNFIVGGDDVKPNELPFVVSILYKHKHHICTASVLNSRWVLTAAHCLDSHHIFDLSLVIGSVSYSTKEAEYHYEIERWITNGCFKPRFNYKDDIALIKTKKDIDIDYVKIGTVCLPPQDAEPLNDDVLMAGWGAWHESEVADTPDILQKTTAKLYSKVYCPVHQWYRNIGFYWRTIENTFCLMSEESTGDSGGPAIQTVNGQMYQIGIAHAITAAMGPPVLDNLNTLCPKGNPFYYFKTSKYIVWITEVIEMFGSKTDANIFASDCTQN